MKNIGTYLPFIAIAGLIAFAIFGGRTFGQPGSQSDKQFVSMNLTSIEVTPPRISISVNDTSPRLSVSAIRSQVGTSSGSSKVVTNNLTFKSSDERVATVSSGGQITGVTPGTANITISYSEGNTTQTTVLRVTVTSVQGT